MLMVALFTALGYFIILYKILGKKRLAKSQKVWDVIFTFGIPVLFIGTFSGMATAAMAGVIFSIFTHFLKQ